MADRWPIAECLRDVFELLAHEVPLVDRPDRPPTHTSEKSAAAIKQKTFTDPYTRYLSAYYAYD